MEWGTQSSVDDQGFTTINFNYTYINPVLICSAEYSDNTGTSESDGTTDSVVCRVDNLGSTSADVALQEAGGSATAGNLANAETIHYLVVEEGDYDTDDIKLEAFTYNSTVTDRSSSWVGQSQSYTQTYTNPVVLTQVQTFNDTDWSVAYSMGASTAAAPDATNLKVGKHVGADTNTTRSNETIGVIVIEQANDTFSDVIYEARLQTQTIDRIDDAASTNYTFNTAFSSTPEVAIISEAGVSGTDGPHPVLSGATPLSTTTIALTIMEDEIGDTEQSGNTEYTSYIVFESSGSESNVSYDQISYRFYENTDAIQPSVAKAAENSMTRVRNGDVIRLRTDVQIGITNLTASEQAFKLQYGQGSTCSAIGTWTDVGAAGSGVIWRGYDNATPADGATITTSLLNSGTNTLQSYEEGNDSVSNPTAVTKGNRGEWDWAIQNNGATDNLDYCFRMVLDNDETLVYTNYPKVTAGNIDISGTCKQVNESTDCTDTGTVTVAVNGVVQAQTQPTVAGTWTISTLAPPAFGDIITIFIDGAANANEATAVTKYDGLGDITGMALYEGHLSIGSSTNQAVTLTDLGLYDFDDDEDILHTSNASVLTVDGGADHSADEIIILPNNTLSIGTTESMSTQHLDNDGTLTLIGNASIDLTGDWDNDSSATFTAGDSTITFEGTTDQTITSSSDAFYDVIINNTGASGSDDIILTDDLDINNDLTITDGDLDQNTNTVNITLTGDWDMGGNGSLDAGASTETVILEGTAQTIYGSTTFNNLTMQDTTDNGTDISLSIGIGTTQTIAGTLTLEGLDGNDRINIQSTSGGTRFMFDILTSGQNVKYVDVQDSETSTNNITTINSNDNGNTDATEAQPHWVFEKHNAVFFGTGF